MAAKFELKDASGGKFTFNLKAGNGEVILTGQTYTTKEAANNGIESVRKNAPFEDRYERRESKSGQPYFVLKAANQQIIGNSEMYSGKSAMENGIASVQKNGPGAKLDDLTGE